MNITAFRFEYHGNRQLCTVCGELTEKFSVTACADTERGKLMVCEHCIQHRDFDGALEANAQRYEVQVKLRRELIGQLQNVPSVEEWTRAVEEQRAAETACYGPQAMSDAEFAALIARLIADADTAPTLLALDALDDQACAACERENREDQRIRWNKVYATNRARLHLMELVNQRIREMGGDPDDPKWKNMPIREFCALNPNGEA